MSTLCVTPLQTRVFRVGEDLAAFVLESVPRELVKERMFLLVTSKIVSLAEKRLVPMAAIAKNELIRREADVFLGEVAYGCCLTIKEGLFIPSAGIDESNSEHGDFILYPESPFESARRLHDILRSHWKLEELGLIITDSHTTPLRKGVTGISLSHWGFEGIKGMIGTEDLFGRKLKMTNVNLADGLAGAGVLMMGEGNECQPLAVITGVEARFANEVDPLELRMPPAQDLYAPFFGNYSGSQETRS